MRKCPHCKKKISETAKKCKFCGEWVDEKEDIIDNQNNVEQNVANLENVNSNNQKRPAIIFGTILIIILGIPFIGIIISAFLPRMQNAQGRARDIARQNDLSQMMAAIVTYQGDHGGWPGADRAKNQIPVSGIKSELMSAGLISIPSDPSSGEYTYMVGDNGLLLMANTETEAGSNWVVCDDGNGIEKGHITNDTDFDKIYLCDEVTEGESCSVSTCTYTSKDQLRYIYTRHFIKEQKKEPTKKNNTSKNNTKNSSKPATQPVKEQYTQYQQNNYENGNKMGEDEIYSDEYSHGNTGLSPDAWRGLQLLKEELKANPDIYKNNLGLATDQDAEELAKMLGY